MTAEGASVQAFDAENAAQASGSPTDSPVADSGASLAQLLTLLNCHPDKDAAVHAAIQAVSRTLPRTNTAGTKRPTGPAAQSDAKRPAPRLPNASPAPSPDPSAASGPAPGSKKARQAAQRAANGTLGAAGNGGGVGAGGAPAGGSADSGWVAAAPVLEPAVFMDRECPNTKSLLDALTAAQPKGGPKTALMVLNEYASRLAFEVEHAESADSSLGPFTHEIKLMRNGSPRELIVAGTGRGRNKKDAKQCAGAAVMELLLKTHPASDFVPPPKQERMTAKRLPDKQGLGYQGGGGGGGSRYRQPSGPSGGPAWDAPRVQGPPRGYDQPLVIPPQGVSQGGIIHNRHNKDLSSRGGGGGSGAERGGYRDRPASTRDNSYNAAPPPYSAPGSRFGHAQGSTHGTYSGSNAAYNGSTYGGGAGGAATPSSHSWGLSAAAMQQQLPAPPSQQPAQAAGQDAYGAYNSHQQTLPKPPSSGFGAGVGGFGSIYGGQFQPSLAVASVGGLPGMGGFGAGSAGAGAANQATYYTGLGAGLTMAPVPVSNPYWRGQ